MKANSDISECVRWACVLEASAKKFGNVHRGLDFQNLTYHDLLISSEAIGPVLELDLPIGESVLRCVEATRRVVQTNTNLGIVLLLAPLVKAFLDNTLSLLWGDGEQPSPGLRPPSPAKPGEGERPVLPFWECVKEVLMKSTVVDASNVFRAIRLAKPGGLGKVTEEDVRDEPTRSLTEVMSLAADRDLIARQYVNGFADVRAGFEFLQLSENRKPPCPEFAAWEQPIINLQLWFLERDLDSLVLRKRGMEEARELQKLATELRSATPGERAMFQAALEEWFRAEFPHRNPGTTADLVCASLFVALRTGIIPLPTNFDEYSTPS